MSLPEDSRLPLESVTEGGNDAASGDAETGLSSEGLGSLGTCTALRVMLPVLLRCSWVCA